MLGGSAAAVAAKQSTPWRWPPWPVLLALALIELLVAYPGVLTPDSAVQLQQARTGQYTDWHPPVLPLIWAGLLQLHDDPAVMLVFQLALFWGGAAVYAQALRRAGRNRAAWAVVAVTLFPLFHVYNRMIVKDAALYASLFLASAVIFAGWQRTGARRRACEGGGLALLVLAALIRANAVFAVAPLLVSLLTRRLRPGWLMLAALSIAGSAVLIPAARFVNQTLLAAQPSDIVQSLQLFDLLGIQHHARDGGVWGDAGSVSQADADTCYTAFYWDTVMQGGVCEALRKSMGARADLSFSAQAIAQRQRLWLQAIQQHPWAYLRHRLAHFNSSLYFIVPPRHVPAHLAFKGGGPEAMAAHQADLRRDYFTRSFLSWPVTWLAIACVCLALLAPRAATSADAAFAVALLVSALLYALGYLVVGVATEFRYYLWLNLAVMLAGVVAARDLKLAWSASGTVRWLGAGLVVLVVATGLASRLLGVPFT